MNFVRISLIAAAALAPALSAQTQLVRGDIDSIQGTNLFRLDCTQDVRLVSSTVDLLALHNASHQQNFEYEMQVVDVSTPSQTILDVISATQIPEQFEMGNLRFGQSNTWEVFAAPGSPAWVFVAARTDTGYLPLGAPGTWILGGSAIVFNQGFTNGVGRFQFNYTMPTLPALVGLEVSGQAIVFESGAFRLTNPDCKDIRN